MSRKAIDTSVLLFAASVMRVLHDRNAIVRILFECDYSSSIFEYIRIHMTLCTHMDLIHRYTLTLTMAINSFVSVVASLKIIVNYRQVSDVIIIIIIYSPKV